MFQLSKKWKCAAGILLCLLIFCLPVQANGLPLCDEDELALIQILPGGDGPSVYQVYDSEGVYLGRTLASFWDSWYPVDSSWIQTSREGDNCNVYLLSQGMKNFQIPGNCNPAALGNNVIADWPETGEVTLFDRDGKALFHLDAGEPAEGSYYDVRYTACGDRCLIGQRLVYYANVPEDQRVREPLEAVYYLDSGGKLIRQIHDPEILSAFFDGRFCAQEYQWIVMKDSQYYLYDLEEQLVSRLPAEHVDYIMQRDGFVTNMRYPELEDQICDGFVRYENPHSNRYVPYALEDGGVLVWTGTASRHIRLEPEETVEAVNEDAALIQMRRNGEDAGCRIVSVLDSRELARYDDTSGIRTDMVQLGDGYCILPVEKESYTFEYLVTDYEGNTYFHITDGLVSGWKNGYFCLQHGIYSGIMDLDGNWVLRTICMEE